MLPEQRTSGAVKQSVPMVVFAFSDEVNFAASKSPIRKTGFWFATSKTKMFSDFKSEDETPLQSNSMLE